MKISEQDLRRSSFSYFLGKLITVQTTSSAIQYDNTERSTFIHFKTFGGTCEGFDEYGIWLRDEETKTKSFYFYSHIQGIVEQQKVGEDHPVVKQAMEKVKQQQQQQYFPPEPDLTTLSVDKLQKVVNKNGN